MEAETLKKIAEAMGLCAEIAGGLCCVRKGRVEDWQFNPEENPAQLIEVIKWLLQVGDYELTNDDGHYFIYRYGPTGIEIYVCHDDSFEAAVMQAAAKEVE